MDTPSQDQIDVKDFHQLRLDVKDIKDALLGNQFKKKGVIDAVNEHSGKIEKIEEDIRLMKLKQTATEQSLLQVTDIAGRIKKLEDLKIRMIALAIGAGIGMGVTVTKIIISFVDGLAK